MISIVVAVSIPMSAGETDHFAARSKKFQSISVGPEFKVSSGSFYEKGQDIAVYLNYLIEHHIKIAMNQENDHRYKLSVNDQNTVSSCSKNDFAKRISETFYSYVPRKQFDDLTRGAPQFEIDRKESIYADFDETDGPLFKSLLSHRMMSSIYRVGNYFVSADKFEHFFELGEHMFNLIGQNQDLKSPAKYEWQPLHIKNFSNWELLKAMMGRVVLRGRSGGNLIDALLLSLSTEQGVMGLTNNGILSYSDMVANYQGLLFYQSLFEGQKPFFRCDGINWVRTERKFNVLDYVDDAWDESINCNVYATEATANKVKKAIDELEVSACPVKPKACDEIREKYKHIEKYVISPLCVNTETGQ